MANNIQFDIEPVPGQEEQVPEKQADVLNTLKAIGKFLWELAKIAVIVIALTWFIRHFLIQPFLVSGDSMEPNFHDDQYILIEKASAQFKGYHRGDVIVFKAPKNVNDNYIKRIIALPGEKIEIQNGKVTIKNKQHPDGAILEENYIERDTSSTTYYRELGPDEFFVMGDNRTNSSDSREWGLLKKDKILGKAWLSLYPQSNFGFTKKPSLNITQIHWLKHTLILDETHFNRRAFEVKI